VHARVVVVIDDVRSPPQSVLRFPVAKKPNPRAAIGLTLEAPGS
jgi:hypothetical protein